MDPTLIIDALTGVLDLETGHQWTSDPIPTDLFGKPADLVINATPTSAPAGGSLNLEDLLADAVDVYEGKSFTSQSIVVAVPAPGGAKNFAIQLTYTVTGGAPAPQAKVQGGSAGPQDPKTAAKPAPGQPGTRT